MRPSRKTRLSGLLLGIAAASAPALLPAQGGAAAAAAHAAEASRAAAVLASAGEEGFQLRAADNSFSLRIKGGVQYDSRGTVRGGEARAGALRVAAGSLPEGADARLVIRSYDLKFWREDEGVGTVRRVLPLGDRVRVEADLDGAGPLFAQFPRRSRLLRGIEPGARIAVEVTRARVYPAAGAVR